MASILGNPNTAVRKTTIIETTTPLLAGAVFTGPWHDSTEDGTVFIECSAIASANSAATLGVQIQESDDNIGSGSTADNVAIKGAATLTACWGNLRKRYWRIVYTNGGSNLTFLTIFVTTVSVPMVAGNLSGSQFDTVSIGINSAAGVIGDNSTSNATTAIPTVSAAANLTVFAPIYGGAFSGTADATRQGWSRPRTPTVFRSVTTIVAAGSTPLWTPAAGNKFRLLRYIIEISANATLAAAGVLTIKLLDGAGDIAQNHIAFIPAAAGTLEAIDIIPEIDLGQFGILSAAANNVLNVNLSAALTAGSIAVLAMGTEE